MALEEDLPEKPDDKTIPKYRQIDKVCQTPVSPSLLFPLKIPISSSLHAPPTIYHLINLSLPLHSELATTSQNGASSSMNNTKRGRLNTAPRRRMGRGLRREATIWRLEGREGRGLRWRGVEGEARGGRQVTVFPFPSGWI